MKIHKKVGILVACVALSAAVAGLSACSVLIPVFGGESNDGDQGGGSGGIGGTYTFDLSVYDAAWSDNVVDSSLWRTTANVGAYATDTLVLNEDGSYELTKEMGADETAVERWGGDGDLNFNRYTYYGTYTADGSTVTLSEVTKIAVEVDIFEMSLGYNLGNYVIEYTETDDLTFGAGTCGGETVMDLYYGPYIVDSGMGNCSQVVTLGTYDWGTFTFSGTVSGDDGDNDDDDDDDMVTDTRASYTFTSETNAEITFTVYDDGTYTFAWEANSVEESGTYTWDRLTQTLTLIKPDENGTTQPVVAEDGVLGFTYYYSLSDQLYQAYTGTVEELEAVICEVVYEMIPSSSGSNSLKLYGDLTYTAVVDGITETGTCEWDSKAGLLVLTTPDGSTISSTIDGNLVIISYGNEVFIGSYSVMEDSIFVTRVIYSFVPGSGNEAISLEFYDNGTYKFEFATYDLSDYGTWTYEGGDLIVSSANSEVTVTISGDEISLYYNYGNGLDQTFTGSVSGLAAAMVESGMTDVVYSFTPGSGNEAISLEFYDNGTYKFEFATYGLTDYGTWTYEGGELVVASGSSEVTVTISGDEISLYYNYGPDSGLDQTFTGSVSGLAEAMIEAGMTEVIYSFVPGSGNTAISLEFYDNGTYKFTFATPRLSDYGTWTYENGGLTVTGADSEVTVAISGDEINLYYDYGSGLDQTFTGSVSGLAEAMIEADMTEVIYSFVPGSGNEAISLEFYDNGTYKFEFATYGLADYGTWAYEDGELVVTSGSSEVTVTISGDEISLYYNYGPDSGLDQTFYGSITALEEAIYGGAE